MKITIKKLVDWNVALESALFTINKDGSGKMPSDSWKKKACLSEHSMLRDVRFVVEIEEIPSWVSQHIARHDAFANHTVRESAEVHYVGTSRTDRTGIDRNKMPQDALVNHRINLSAQDFITISKLRLCTCASKETRNIWNAVLDELRKIDSVLANSCVKSCLYRGFCPEFESCGFDKTVNFEWELAEYRNRNNETTDQK